MSRQVRDITGERFGDLVVISFADFQRPNNKKDRRPAWLCKCVCGVETVIRSSSLLDKKNGPRKCKKCSRANMGLNYNNLIGQKFGRLLVLSKADRPAHVSNGSQYWNVRCDCGKEKLVSSQPLTKGTTVSCGCYSKEINSIKNTTHGLSSNYGAYKKLRLSKPTEKMKHSVGVAVRSAIQRQDGFKNSSIWKVLPYNADDLKQHLESLWEPWMSWDNYGGTSNDIRKTWWVDHIVPQSALLFNSLDHPNFLECWSLKNLRPLEKKANMSKGSNL